MPASTPTTAPRRMPRAGTRSGVGVGDVGVGGLGVRSRDVGGGLGALGIWAVIGVACALGIVPGEAVHADGATLGAVATTTDPLPADDPRWSNAFALPGLDAEVLALTTFQDELIAAGRFTNAGGTAAYHIARWDGERWRPLGDGWGAVEGWGTVEGGGGGGGFAPGPNGTDGDVMALAVYDGALIAAGNFTRAGGVAAAGIARWDGNAWQPLGRGLADLPPPSPSGRARVQALAVHEGSLYAGGAFALPDAPGGVSIARWDGTAWHALGRGVTGADLNTAAVRSLVSFGGELVATGDFTEMDGVPVPYMARWDGSRWAAFPADFDRAPDVLAVIDGRLIAGGAFARAGGIATGGVAVWDGGSWRALGGGAPGDFPVTRAVASYGGGVVIAGSFIDPTLALPNVVRLWDGRAWRTLGHGFGGGLTVRALHVFRGELIAAGSFTDADGAVASRIARFDGRAWQALSAGEGIDGPVRALFRWRRNVYAAGVFRRAGSAVAHNVARWDGSRWNGVGSAGGSAAAGQGASGGNAASGSGVGRVGVGGGGPALSGQVLVLTEYDDHLVAAGDLEITDTGDGTPSHATPVATWDGSRWAPLGEGLAGRVFAATTHRGELWVAGELRVAGDPFERVLAVWNGSAWRAVALELDIGVGRPRIQALASYRGDLVFAGRFTVANGQFMGNIGRFDGRAWSPLGPGLDEVVEDVQVIGDRLYVAGFFNYAGNAFTPQVAMWDGALWHGMGEGLQFDDVIVPGALLRLGRLGGDLVLAGRFDGVDFVPAANVARWDGAQWLALGPGVNGRVLALADGGGGQLFLGGDFTRAGARPAHHVALWNGGGTPLRITDFTRRLSTVSVEISWRLPEDVLARTVRVAVWRALRPAGAEELLTASAGPPAATMHFSDPTAVTGSTYDYRLELFDDAGGSVSAGPFRVLPDGTSRNRLRVARDSDGALRVLYTVGIGGPVRLDVYDVRGRRVRTLDHTTRPAGEYVATWDLTDVRGRRVARGLYLVRLLMPGFERSAKVMVVRTR